MVSSSALLADLFAFSLGVGLGGAVLALGERLEWGVELSAAGAIGLGVVMIALALGSGLRLRSGYAASPASPRTMPDHVAGASALPAGCSSGDTGTNPSPGT